MREKKIIQTSIIGILGNILLVAMKVTIGIITNAISVISDGINNLTDALSSLITIIGTKLSNKKPDKKHPYGHGRIEYLTSLIIAILVVTAGVTAISQAIRSFINNEAYAQYSELALIMLSIGILVKLGLGLLFRHNGKKYQSDALSASGVDAISDVVLSLSTLIVAIICFFVPDASKIRLENYLSILIGLFIVKAGVDILRDSISNIIGRRANSDVTNGIKAMVNSFPQVHGAYDLILNNYGPEKIIGSIHIQVDDELPAKEIHRLTKEIQTKAFQQFRVVLTVGIYASNNDDYSIQIKKDLQAILKKYPQVIQMHGFYLDQEKKLCTFDIIFSFDKKDHKQDIDAILKEIQGLHPDYQFFAIEDLDISD